MEGARIYKEENRTITLNKYDEVEIPIEITHSVEATQDSLCILNAITSNFKNEKTHLIERMCSLLTLL